MGREEENRSPGWAVLAGQGVLGGQLELCHFDGRAADGRCALMNPTPKRRANSGSRRNASGDSSLKRRANRCQVVFDRGHGGEWQEMALLMFCG